MKHTRTPIASAVALVLLGAVATAHAQTAAKADLNTVTVTGIRASQEQSLNVKKDFDSRVEVISAEDIGKMPDKNVADSLQRVAGVSTSSASANEGGFDENDRVSMRGTNPSLTQTLINGHSVGSGDWFVLNQTGTVGRSVSYSLLPSALVGQIIVHKGSEASLVEGGVSGSVNIITRKPLDFKKPFTAEVSIGAVNAVLPGKTDPQLSGLVNWMNADKTVGVMVQAFSEKRSLRRDGVEVLGYSQFKPTDPAVLARPDLNGVYYPNFIGAALFEQVRTREGGLIDVQVKPSNDLTLGANFFSSNMKADNYNRNYALWPVQFANKQAPNPGYVVQNNTLVSATYAAVPGNLYGVYDMISRPNSGSSSTFAAFDAKLRVNDALTLKGQAGTSEGHGKTPTQDVFEYVSSGHGGSYNLSGLGNAPSFGTGNLDNTKPTAATGLDWIFGFNNVDVLDSEKWAQLDGDYALSSGMFTSVKFGVRATAHERSLANVVAQRPGPGAYANLPTSYSTYPSNFGSQLGGVVPSGIWYFTADQLAAHNSQYTLRNLGTDANGNTRRYPQAEYSLKEDTLASYLQGNMEGAGWSGNIGVRAVQTKGNATNYVTASSLQRGAINTADGFVVPVATENNYNDFLPSANLKIDLAKNMIGRFAVSKTMSRPDFSALAGAVSLSPPSDPTKVGGGSGGNPNLAPIRSNNVDATFEYYFAPRALASAGVFYMDLQNYIGLGSVNQVYQTTNQAFPNGFAGNYVLTVPVNSSGSVKGIELAYEQPVGSNFGFAANYTYIDAKEAGGGPLVGASKNTYNLSGYFENDKFNARLSYTARSSFYSGLDRASAYSQAASGVLSASFGYKVNDNLSFTLDAQNLNDPVLKYYGLNEDQPRAFYQNGRQYYLNARIKF